MRLAAVWSLAAIAFLAVLVCTRSPYSYAAQDRDQIASVQTAAHRFGTDSLGRDRAVRTAGALLLGLVGAATAAAFASLSAVAAGGAAAFAPKPLSKCLLYFCDLAMTLPWLFLLMIVRAALPLDISPAHSAVLTFVLLGAVGAPVFVRMNYVRALAVRRSDWLLYSRACGLGVAQLARTHVLPHLRPLFLTQFVTYVPVCLIAEANLGAMGLGISQPLPSWGSMILELQNSALVPGSHWIYLPLGLLVVVLFLIEMTMFEVAP